MQIGGDDRLDDTDWMFDAFGYIGDAADAAGMRRLASLLELCMDVYVEEERLVRDASMVFRSRRARAAKERNRVWPFREIPTRCIKPAPPSWLDTLEARVNATLSADTPPSQRMG